MMIKVVFKYVVNLGLLMNCLGINIMWWWVLTDGVNHLSLWIPCWMFMWRSSR